MIIGIAGLGLIGGSLARAYKNYGFDVYGYDSDEAVPGFARISGAINDLLDEKSLSLCDALFIAVNPGDTVLYLEKAAPFIAKNAIVIDCCGVKRKICEKCFPLAKEHGFIFIGGHPMAGSHNAGFKNSRPDLFRGASMILVPPVYDDPVLFGRLESLLKPVGFGRLTVTTAEKHDEAIAFSSQMAHVVSNAFIKSPAAGSHRGFSAGSYKDLTRVARLNADMWAQLCMDNNDNLIKELDSFTAEINKYRNALAANDINELKALLEEGSRLKKELDN
ncbi:MAG: prephenate dehydrogenase/arogenate dehydrogenase family protein [Treponema sp.]|nr:prephenate dehydrogenase/arogenate dehydrogenase family protein [Treponema sp.]